MEKQLTFGSQNCDLDNNDNFAPDNSWLAFDTRVNGGAIISNAVIGKVNIEDGSISEIYREPFPEAWGPGVGAANINPVDGSVSFIRGLPSSSACRPYELSRRGGACVRPTDSGVPFWLDSRDITPPFTAGALRGGTHRHEWSGDGQWIGFTYNDAILAEIEKRTGRKVDMRTVGVATAIENRESNVPLGGENHQGEWFSVVVVRVVEKPKPGSDEICRAFEDAWVGTSGYRRTDGCWQTRARAFLGNIRTKAGDEITEVFIVDIPDQIGVQGEEGPLEGTVDTMPVPPRGATQRRISFTEDRRFPGVSLEPRHWVRSSPDGGRVAFLAKDDEGIIQAYFVSPLGGDIIQVTRHLTSIQSAVRWSPDGERILYICGNSVTVCDARPDSPTIGQSRALTSPSERVPESPVWSRNGEIIAFNRMVPFNDDLYKQIFLIHLRND